MSTPSIAPVDTHPALDCRAITPGPAALNPTPRALYFATGGNVVVQSAGADAATTATVPVNGGQILPLRPLRILVGTTATVIALY